MVSRNKFLSCKSHIKCLILLHAKIKGCKTILKQIVQYAHVLDRMTQHHKDVSFPKTNYTPNTN